MAAGIFGAWLGTGLVPAGLLAQSPPQAMWQPPSQPTFRAKVDVVAVTAVVYDKEGRPVRHLSRDDFAVLDQGQKRPIVEFRPEPDGPLSLAIVVDTSGSMRISRKWEMAQDVVRQLVSQLDASRDEAALFAFDSSLREVRRFASDVSAIVPAMAQLQPFGPTALYDAMAAAAERFSEDGPARRAMVVVTDGLDTSSELSAERAWDFASRVDAPAYLVLVHSPIDEGSVETARLGDLVRWTGGQTFTVSATAQATLAARQVAEELRHRYVIAFESAMEPGWHPLEVRTRDRKHVVRTRSGYRAG